MSFYVRKNNLAYLGLSSNFIQVINVSISLIKQFFLANKANFKSTLELLGHTHITASNIHLYLTTFIQIHRIRTHLLEKCGYYIVPSDSHCERFSYTERHIVKGAVLGVLRMTQRKQATTNYFQSRKFKIFNGRLI